MMPRAASFLIALILAGSSRVVAQNSVYGLAGIGFPGEPLSARSRALGGGLAAFDAASALNPAAVARIDRLSAGATFGTTVRRYTVSDTTVSGLRETRFPFGMFGGPVSTTPVSFALGYATYAERTFDVTTNATQMLRGETLDVTDRISSDGAVTDLRAALGLRVSQSLWVGGAVHLIGGSSRLVVQRTFSNTQYQQYSERSHLVFSGTGFSGGAIFRPVRALEIAGVVRSDGGLRTDKGDTLIGTVDLPVSVTGGLSLQPARGIAWSATGTWRSWSTAQSGLFSPTVAFDTWEVSTGLELADPTPNGSRMPLRLGYRYRELPFSNANVQPTETAFTGGTGLVLARGRARVDLAIEHLRRSGGAARERAWHFVVGVRVTP